jgi:hypothetical protein
MNQIFIFVETIYKNQGVILIHVFLLPLKSILMKRIYILLTFVFFINLLQGQDVPETQQSLISKVTATWCINCGTWGWSLYEGLEQDNAGSNFLTLYNGNEVSTVKFIKR